MKEPMLSISKIQGGCDYYLDLAKEDYYLNGGEPPGRWVGKAASFFGLKTDDIVLAPTIKPLFAGYHPITEMALVKNPQNDNRTSGWDLTFSAPKSLSTLWSQASLDVRQTIQRIHHEAVKEALDFTQEVAGYTRRGTKGGEMDCADLLFAVFEHGTSRAQDPQLHSHAVLQNVGVRPDGTTGTIHTQALYDHKMAIGAAYRLVLAQRLRAELGVHVEVRKNTFEIVGVDNALMNVFSTRALEIREEMARRGLTGAKAAEAVTLATRHAKESAIPREQLFERWQYMGRVLGWTHREAAAVLHRPKFQSGMEIPLAAIVERAFEKLVDDRSVVTKRELFAKAATEAVVHGASIQQVQAAIGVELSSPRAVLAGMVETEPCYTRSDLVKAESDLAGLIERSRHTSHHVLSKEVFREVMRLNPHLTDEQKDAVKVLTRRKGSVVCLTGIAGAGKTTVLDAAKQAWESAGYTVVGVAPTNKAARNMEESSGIPSSSIHAFLNKSEGRAIEQKGKRLIWKMNDEVMKTLRANLSHRAIQPAHTIVRFGPLRLEVHKQRPLEALNRGLLSKTRMARWLAKREWGHLRIGLLPKTVPRGKPADQHRRTLFSLGGLRLEVWKHPPCWRGIGPMSRIEVPYLRFGVGPKGKAVLDRKTIVTVDEAGMADTKLMKDLMTRVAAAGAKIALIGDGRLRQIQPVQAGSPFEAISKAVPAFELLEIRRQKDAADKKVVMDFAQGKSDEALKSLIARGRYHQSPTPDDCAKSLIDLWSEKFAKTPQSGLIVAATNEWNDRLNREAQNARIKAGLLGPETVQVGDTEFRPNDRVLITGNNKVLGVLKGDLGTIKSLRGSHIQILLDSGKEVRVPTLVFQNIRLGYSITTHRAQGATVDNVLIMAGPSWINRELTYVQASRARKEIHIFCDEVTAGHERSGLIQRMAISQKKGSIADAIEERRERAEARKLKLSEPQEKNTLPRQREARKFEHSPSA
jgi:conjugative relaxase-like TrwC/TraI family protein